MQCCALFNVYISRYISIQLLNGNRYIFKSDSICKDKIYLHPLWYIYFKWYFWTNLFTLTQVNEHNIKFLKRQISIEQILAYSVEEGHISVAPVPVGCPASSQQPRQLLLMNRSLKWSKTWCDEKRKQIMLSQKWQLRKSYFFKEISCKYREKCCHASTSCTDANHHFFCW